MAVQFGYVDFCGYANIFKAVLFYISILEIENINITKYIEHLKRNWVREFADLLTFI